MELTKQQIAALQKLDTPATENGWKRTRDVAEHGVLSRLEDLGLVGSWYAGVLLWHIDDAGREALSRVARDKA